MSNILFICRGNVGRSQIAQALWQRAAPQDVVASAGTEVGGHEGEVLAETASARNVLQAMREDGLDLSAARRAQLTPELVTWADRIFVMAESETWPDFLRASERVAIWKIEDLFGASLEETRVSRDIIKVLVEKASYHNGDN